MAHVFITGGNRGIGLALTKQCIARGDTVTVGVRKPSAELQATAATIVPLDVTDDASLAALPRHLASPIDCLINNAGVLHGDALGLLDPATIRQQFEVNALAPLRVTAACLPHLKQGSKVAIVTSRMGSIADNGSGSMYGYRMSKAAVNAAGKSLALDLAPRGIAVVLLHPGFVRTDMTEGRGNMDPEESAAGLLAQIDALTVETTGQFLHMNGESLPW